MWKNISIVVTCMCAFTFSYPANNQIGNYHYDPPVGRRLELPVQIHAAASNQQPTFQLPTQLQQQLQQQSHLRQRKSQQSSASFTNTLTSQGYNTNSASDDHENNIHDSSVRLPLPLGVASINIEPLPLSQGFVYSELPELTSYDVKPQRV